MNRYEITYADGTVVCAKGTDKHDALVRANKARGCGDLGAHVTKIRYTTTYAELVRWV